MPQSAPTSPDEATFKKYKDRFTALADGIGKVVRGKDSEIRRSLVCLLAEGHLLIEDVPGVAKTTLARCMAAAIGGECRRIQFTPDLLPADITGLNVYNQATREYEFREGPVFANVVIADEINRASPKTQSALLEVMEERQVTTAGAPEFVPSPFFVVATQNPIDMEGTYPLPEAQLDRFLMRVRIGYPDPETEADIADTRAVAVHKAIPSQLVEPTEFDWLVQTALRVRCERRVLQYAVGIAAATRAHPDLRLGASPRGSIALIRAARVWAASNGRGYVSPDDVSRLAHPVLEHRLLPTLRYELSDRDVGGVLAHVIDGLAVPRGSGQNGSGEIGSGNAD